MLRIISLTLTILVLGAAATTAGLHGKNPPQFPTR
jgi:hypothetical protein